MIELFIKSASLDMQIKLNIHSPCLVHTVRIRDTSTEHPQKWATCKSCRQFEQIYARIRVFGKREREAPPLIFAAANCHTHTHTYIYIDIVCARILCNNTVNNVRSKINQCSEQCRSIVATVTVEYHNRFTVAHYLILGF